MYTISHLFIYPVKSLGGFEVPSAKLTEKGFEYDRRWMLVDSSNQFITQRHYPQMSLLQTTIKDGQLLIFHKKNVEDKISVPLQMTVTATTKVNIWDDECAAQYVSRAADEWLSRKLKAPCRLVYMPDSEKRKVDERYTKNGEVTNFSDGYPLMMLGLSSLQDLNSRLVKSLPIDRFRPNIVFTGGKPYDEDTMEHIVVNKTDLYGVKLCARCAITTIDQATGVQEKEPLKTLAKYRRWNNNIYFGQNFLFKQIGSLNLGNAIEIVRSKSSIF